MSIKSHWVCDVCGFCEYSVKPGESLLTHYYYTFTIDDEKVHMCGHCGNTLKDVIEAPQILEQYLLHNGQLNDVLKRLSQLQGDINRFQRGTALMRKDANER